MKDEYREGLKQSWISDKGGIPPECHPIYERSEWTARTFNCALRIYSATCFRETSGEYLDRMGDDLILPPIGFYYSLFHLGVAMVFLDHTTRIELIKHSKDSPLTHSRLIKLMKNALVSRGFMSKKTLKLFLTLKQIRDQTNYSFVTIHRVSQDRSRSQVSLSNIMHSAYQDTGLAFDEAFNFIESVSNTAGENINGVTIGQWISSLISDSGFIDDLPMIYMSNPVISRVNSYLMGKSIMH